MHIGKSIRRTLVCLAAVAALPFLCGAQETYNNDPSVRIGRLSNGLTYYICHNETQKGRADFYLASHVGAIQEEPSQDGLAHFLEHMSFNGTEHFPGREIIQYLQGIGASFGENINAATGIEKTTYKISDIPVSRTSVVDSCIMILCDFSHYIINNPVDIDAERKVILEERRSRMNSQWRMQSKGQELLYRGTRYAACSLIGSEENLRSFPPEALVDFYRTWYRPDLQAVVVVGDIDPDYVEKTIEKTFSGISMPQDPKPREAIEIPSNREPIVGVITDREALGTSIEVIWKRRPVPRDERNTSTALEKELSESIITLVMAERLQGIVSDQDSAPFVNASLSFGDLTESCNALVGGVMARDGKALPALEGFMEEMERMKRYGFTSEEISRARTNLLSAARSNLESSSTRKNSEIVEDCLAHFFDAECFPSPKDLSDAVTRCLGRLTDQRVNQEAASCITDTNMVVLYKAPEKAGLTHPSEEDILRVVLDARARQVAPPSTDSLPDRFVDPSTIRKGKIRKTRSYLYGSKIWTLSNGMNVVLMPTDREKDMVRIELVKKGGLSLIPTEDLDSFEENIFSLFLQNQGAGKFSAVQGSKMLSGKEVSVAPFMGSHTHGIEAACSRKDIYTALELVYLEFTEPRFDESEYSQGIQTIRTMLPNVINQPYFVLERALAKTAYGSSPRHTMLSEEVLDRASLQTVERNWRRIFDGVNGATVFIVGDFDIKEIRPLVETFLASLPKGGEPSQWKDNKDGIASGSATEEATLSMIDPIVTVYEIYKLDTGYTPKKEAALSALEFILNTLYISTMRQKIGGTYSATVASQFSRVPSGQAVLQVSYNSKPSLSETLQRVAFEAFRVIAVQGPTEEEFSLAMKNIRKKLPESRNTVSYWMSCLKDSVFLGGDPDTDLEKAMDELTPLDIQKAAEYMLNDADHFKVVLSPEK